MIESVVPIQVEPIDGGVRVIATVTEVGGKTYKREFIAGTRNDPGQQIIDIVTAENDRDSRIASGVTSLVLNVPLNLGPKPPVDPVPPTAQQIWAGKASRLIRGRQFGLTASKAVADLADLEADVNATYETGYL